MKITKEQLKQIIKEELAKELEERDTYQLANPDRDVSQRQGDAPLGSSKAMIPLILKHAKSIGASTGTNLAQDDLQNTSMAGKYSLPYMKSAGDLMSYLSKIELDSEGRGGPFMQTKGATYPITKALTDGVMDKIYGAYAKAFEDANRYMYMMYRG